MCTANRFRSVVVADALRNAWHGWGADVTSYASRGPSGCPPLDAVTAELALLGRDVGGCRSRAISEADLRGCDLVVGFELEHLAAAVTLAGARRSRAVLLGALHDAVPAGGVTERSVRDAARWVAPFALRAADASAAGAGVYPDPAGARRARQRVHVRALWLMGSGVGCRIRGLPEPPPAGRARPWRAFRR